MKLKAHVQAFAAFLAFSAGVLHAQTVEVSDAWVRATVQGQTATGAFMKLTSKEGAKLVGAASPVAEVVEVHEMRLEGDVMKMRAAPVIELPAGKTVELKPGSYHVMLMDLKSPLKQGDTVPLTLTIKDARGAERKVEVRAPVGMAAPGAKAGPMRPMH